MPIEMTGNDGRVIDSAGKPLLGVQVVDNSTAYSTTSGSKNVGSTTRSKKLLLRYRRMVCYTAAFAAALSYGVLKEVSLPAGTFYPVTVVVAGASAAIASGCCVSMQLRSRVAKTNQVATTTLSRTVMEAGLVSVLCDGFMVMLHNPFCGWVFRCGCVASWAGGWANCNVHNPTVRVSTQ